MEDTKVAVDHARHARIIDVAGKLRDNEIVKEARRKERDRTARGSQSIMSLHSFINGLRRMVG